MVKKLVKPLETPKKELLIAHKFDFPVRSHKNRKTKNPAPQSRVGSPHSAYSAPPPSKYNQKREQRERHPLKISGCVLHYLGSFIAI